MAPECLRRTQLLVGGGDDDDDDEDSEWPSWQNSF